MSHLKSHVELPTELAAFYDVVNETAEGQGVHPGTDGVNIADISDTSSLNALVAIGAAKLEDTSGGQVVKLIGSPADEEGEEHQAQGGKAVAKDSQFANAPASS